jgi:ribose 5-phosphate isomerase A
LTQDQAKQAVARRAVDFVADGMRVGLGTGSTATLFIHELAARVKAEGLHLRCVASSASPSPLSTSFPNSTSTSMAPTKSAFAIAEGCS